MRSALLALLLCLLPLSAVAGSLIDPRLGYLIALRGDLEADLPENPKSLAELAPLIARQELFAGSLRFVSRPSAETFSLLEQLGVEFYDFGSGPAGSRTVYPARIPYESLSIIEKKGAALGLARIECSWRPGAPPPLAQSRPQIEAELAWEQQDFGGDPLTGEGVLVADFDTGIFYLHPAFFRLSGEVYDWLDVDESGGLSPGDAVDLDGNGLPGASEALLYFEAGGVEQYGNAPGFDAEFDFLFNDANMTGGRDYGPPAFGENDPTYGECIYLVDDTNDSGELDPGERLLALGASMIRAIYNKDGGIHTRGVDLLDSEMDDWGHGTQVGGIFGGGWAKRNAMTGIAPGVEAIYFDNDYTSEPPFLVPIEAGLAWANSEGADVVLIEDGEWIWEFLDGSSNVEIMMNEFSSDEAIIFVVPAGNLANGRMHTHFSTNDTYLEVNIGRVIWLDFLWFDANEPQLTLTPPGGTPLVVPPGGSVLIEQGYSVYGLISISDRGVRRWDLRIASDPAGSTVGGDWGFHFSSVPPEGYHGFFWDDVSGWVSPSRWETLDEGTTVTWPATADSAISVAAYNPDGDGPINGFSGAGPRIDGRADVDIAAPGSTVFSVHPIVPGAYAPFGGTSSAGPHVTGAVALLRQLFPGMDSGACRAYLRAGAAQDEYTNDPDRWGAGKLRIWSAIASALTDVADSAPTPGFAIASYPNPFNPTTTLRFQLPESGAAELRFFSVDGRQVDGRALPAGRPGWREFTWDARGLPSGVYFAHLAQGDRSAATRLTLLK